MAGQTFITETIVRAIWFDGTNADDIDKFVDENPTYHSSWIKKYTRTVGGEEQEYIYIHEAGVSLYRWHWLVADNGVFNTYTDEEFRQSFKPYGEN